MPKHTAPSPLAFTLIVGMITGCPANNETATSSTVTNATTHNGSDSGADSSTLTGTVPTSSNPSTTTTDNVPTTTGDTTNISTTDPTTSTGPVTATTTDPTLDPSTSTSTTNTGASTVGDSETGDATGADTQERRIFITSGTMNGGKLFGLPGADGICIFHAQDANLPNPGNYIALLSDNENDALTRLAPDFTGVYVLNTDPPTIVGTRQDLVSDTLEAPINIDEWGTSVSVPSAKVWIGTSDLEGGLTCNGWASNNALEQATVGDPQLTDGGWRDIGPMPCNDQFFRLYCVENPVEQP